MRKFLVVIDETPECINALRFATVRAARTGGMVEVLFIIEPGEFQHWIGVGEVMRQEAREAAEARFESLKSRVEALAKEVSQGEVNEPHLTIREGIKTEEVLAAIREDPEIGVLVLGAGTEGDGPGPLVSQLAGKMAGEMPVPVTVVPGSMTKEQIISVC